MSLTLYQLKTDGTRANALIGLFAALLLLGLAAFYYMETHGHVVTGMNNQIVWGLPHVFAVFLIVAASGALNFASMVSVFGKTELKPLAPLSGLLAIALLIGGLSVLLADLGRPDRLIVAMTHFNFKSIFTWNIFLYTGFIAFIVTYLWTMMEPSMNRHTPTVGLLAFLWRITLTTGTGSIFGFLVARSAYVSAIMAPMFVTLSLSYGLAVFVLLLFAVNRATGQTVGEGLLSRFARLQIIFISAGLYFVLAYHLTNLYFTKHHDLERFLLLEGGIYTALFWLGQVIIGGIIPMLLLRPADIGTHHRRQGLAAGMVIIGGFAQMYVTIIGGQAFPMPMFPGYEVSSSFFDGIVNSYVPTIPELFLGIGGVAVAGLIVSLALRVMRFLPGSLDDAAMGLDQPATVKS
jgi:molybdopterin-containing oxidoreductase family membrane subunit